MAFRQERLERIIERELGMIISREVKDDRLKFVTITKVALTNDLSIATVYYTILGDQEQRVATEANLQDAKGFIRSSLGRKLDVRKIPELRFKFDESLQQGQKIEDILKNLKNHS
jgi:ribosome-binding factor A